MPSIIEYTKSLDYFKVFRKDGYGITDETGMVIGKDINLDVPPDVCIVILAKDSKKSKELYESLIDCGHEIKLANYDVAVTLYPTSPRVELKLYFRTCGTCKKSMMILGVSKEDADKYYSNPEFGLYEFETKG